MCAYIGMENHQEYTTKADFIYKFHVIKVVLTESLFIQAFHKDQRKNYFKFKKTLI